MIKEAMQYILTLGKAEKHEIGGQIFSDKPLHRIPQPNASALTVHNLSGLVDYLKSNYDKVNPVLIQVVSPTKVNVYSTFDRDRTREHYLEAEALLPKIPFENFMSLEHINILLQSCFVPNDHRETMLKIVGNVRDEEVMSFGDDGVSQQVTAKTGVAQTALVPVPNPVLLKPFRTFVDIEQPISQFIFRMRKGPQGPEAALFGADGGAWKLDAITAISIYLDGALKDEIKSGFVTIIA